MGDANNKVFAELLLSSKFRPAAQDTRLRTVPVDVNAEMEGVLTSQRDLHNAAEEKKRSKDLADRLRILSKL